MSLALPSRTSLDRRSRATRTAGVVLALALGLSGCGAGLRAQTYQERTTSDSTNEAIGALAIRHIRILPPTGAETHAVGSDARVGVVVVNEGAEADRLTSVTSDVAASVDVLGPNGQPTTLSVEPNTANGNVVFVLRGITRELRPGQYVQMELTFAENGTETMLVPVEVTGTPGPRREGYEIAHLDSAGNVIEKEKEKEKEEGKGEGGEAEPAEPGAGTAEEGSSDRPELDNDGADAGSGDQMPIEERDTSGDENGGAGATSPPLEES